MTLRSLLGKYDRKLRRYCKGQLRQNSKTASAVWVTDNYRLCKSSFITAKGYASRNGEKGLLPLFLMCKKFFSHPFQVTSDRIIAFFSAERMSVAECEALPTLLFAAASAVVCDNLYEGSGELVISCMKNLSVLREIDFSEVMSSLCRVEKYLSEDPAGIYEKMNHETKKQYRYAVVRGAKKEGISEPEFVRKALNLAREEKKHIGFYLPLEADRKKTAVIFFICEWILAFLLSIVAGIFSGKFYVPFLLILPVYALIRPFSDRIASRIFPPRKMFGMSEKLDFPEGVVITVSSLLPDASKCEELYSHLGRLRASNSLKNVKILLLADRKNSPTPESPSDKADTEAAKRLIDSLNKDFGSGFLLAVRDRVFSSGENEYTGFERKRGAIAALTKYIEYGDVNGFSLIWGDKDGLSEMKYLLALDSDTEMSFEVLRSLLAAAVHPLNEPRFSADKKRIVSGFGVLTPRVETSLRSASKTLFSKLFTSGGSLPYSPEVNERYTDMFGEGIFSGKGLINISAFNCTVADKFDNGRILSHDILEGAVLRTGFIAVSELTDSFPSTVNGYYGRLHRWIRGDVQNLKYIFKPLGENGDSPEMPTLGKYQLFDNFRRAYTPVAAFWLMLLSCFVSYREGTILMLAAILSVIAEFLPDILFTVFRFGTASLSSLYLSKEISGINKTVIRAVLALGALPAEAAVRADAITKALYRSLISKKHLLQWQTAASADSESGKNTFLYIVFPVFIAGISFIFGTAFHRLYAICILLFLPFVFMKGIKIKETVNREISEEERRTIISYAALAWRFFEENVTKGENYLPPDNIQESPIPRKARRTSPTNIGLYLVSALAAADMSFITAEELLRKVNNTLTTLERLPKYKGLLYNWYDTVRAVPLRPFYVSSVDCGNYLVCLTALKEGLREYSQGNDAFSDTVKRIENILHESDLSPLYDKNRELFRIGFDCESGKASPSCYDLYMSEARMTSFYACAKRQVPSAHWAHLDRTLKRNSFYVTAASWSGTMFEYFMPALFTEHPVGSFSYEGLKVCLYTQKKKAQKQGIPYGISESCFYSIDPSFNYRYKAHGIKSLALKRDADEESVISPYCTFLTLPFDKKSALKNLRTLSSSYNAEGRYGFYEAVDFCEKHLDGEEFQIVRCFMSHHIGMSIIAMANILSDDIFVKRFMKDPAMESGRSLLEERLPVHPDILRSLKEKTDKLFSPENKNSVPRNAPEDGGEVFSYTNGEITLLCDKFGRNRCLYSSDEIYKYSDRSQGISIGVQNGDKITALFPNNVTLKKYSVMSQIEENGIIYKSAITVHPSKNAILLPVKIKNTSDETKHFTVHWYIEPLLQPVFFKDMHPAFSDMFLKCRYEDSVRAASFGRASENGSLNVAAGLYGKGKANFCFDREKIIKRNPDAENIFEREYECVNVSVRGVSPVLSVSTEITVRGGKSTECVLILAVGTDEEGALSVLSSVRSQPLPAVTKGAAATFLRDKLTFDASCNFIARTFFNGASSEIQKTAVASLDSGREALWEVGISGDIPIITVFPDRSCPELIKRSYIKLYKRLRKSSVPTELVFIFENSADYSFSGDRELIKLLEEEGIADALSVKGGVHILYLPTLKKECFTAVLAFSRLIYPDMSEKSTVSKNILPEILSPRPLLTGENTFHSDGYLINRHPSLPWCHTLSNNTFGTLVSDRSLGYTWAYNSRQNKLTPWSNDTASDLYGERLFIKIGDKLYDAVKNASVFYSPEKAVYASVFEDIKAVISVEVPEKGNKKHITAEIQNLSEEKKDIGIIYTLVPVLGEGGEGNFIKITAENDCVYAKNPLNKDFSGVLYLCSDNKSSEYFSTFSPVGNKTANGLSILQKIAVVPDGKYTAVFMMCFAPDKDSARKLAQAEFVKKQRKNVSFSTGCDAFDEFSNALLYHQVSDTRLRARCGFYQCSGAFGFRDQLQDSLALIGRENRKVKQMIYKAASAQFPEGDVLHWFHPVYRKGLIYKGVRTRISDDLLWLPFTVAEYVMKTGDKSILEKSIPYLEGNALPPGVKDEYREFRHKKNCETLYFHCLRAIEKACAFGEHSLPLMGTGDWNDSFDKVGENGKGESVWLGMFLKAVCEKFAKICDMRKDGDISARLLKTAEVLTSSVDGNAWNGKWYVRAFYDDSTALGDENAPSCETDLLCQAWASLSGMPDKKRVKTALLFAYEKLFSEKDGIVKLFTPPFSEKSKSTGYVNRYPEGMRENGGQYTHAAVWFCIALFKEGLYEQGRKVLNAILPSEKYKNGLGDIYKTEPYALAGDVYSAVGHKGRGGWSLYTGSAGWLVQLAEELSYGKNSRKKQ